MKITKTNKEHLTTLYSYSIRNSIGVVILSLIIIYHLLEHGGYI